MLMMGLQIWEEVVRRAFARVVGTYQCLQHLGAKSLSFKLINQRGERTCQPRQKEVS